MYYALILCAVSMFGINFALQDIYQKIRGDSLKISMQATLIGSIAAVIVLLIINRFKFEYTHFTIIIALSMAVINLVFAFVSFKALSTINLSVYSLFAMLGGMLLPFLQGIIFYNEKFTLAKGLCLLFVIGALLCTIDKKTNGGKLNYIYYGGVFVLNGMSGVLSKIFISSRFAVTSSAGLNMWIAICSLVLSAIALLFMIKNKTEKPITIANSGIIATSGAINKVANFLLVIALMHVETSVQYPMVTGGVIIFSTMLCFLQKKKPTKKEMLSVLLAFVGMLVLFIIPI